MLLMLPVIIALTAGVVLLALVSESFAYALSRVVEATFEFIEYRMALRQQSRAWATRAGKERVSYEASYSRAA